MFNDTTVFGSRREARRLKRLLKRHASSKHLTRLHWGIRHKHPHRLFSLIRTLLNDQLPWNVKKDPRLVYEIFSNCIRHLLRRIGHSARLLNQLRKVKSRNDIPGLQKVWDKAQSILQFLEKDNKANEVAAAADERGGEGSDSDSMDAAAMELEEEQDRNLCVT